MSRIDEIAQADWDGLMASDNPFSRYAFLLALEDCGCVSVNTGWQPRHLTVWQGADLLAVMPLYAKGHSYGEYVFDWAWAEAYERHGLDYYPKLVSAIPFTPVTGPRLGIKPGLSRAEVQRLIDFIAAELDLCLEQQGYSSWHCLFLPAASQQALASQGKLSRLGTQFHWHNRGYGDFGDFLTGLSSRKRKNLQKERARVAAKALTFRFVPGAEVTQAQWHTFALCYRLTYLKRSGHGGYLSQAFFASLALAMPEQLLLLVVEDSSGDMLAGALYFLGEDTLYGRYWGSTVDIDGLHFEACYYQGIDYCIAHGLAHFDAGAQGEHKLARGFEPVATYSNHQIAHDGFRKAIAEFVDEERRQMQVYMLQMRRYLPYKAPD
ncbi:GNAT family N-acetyltransferase [Shewanella salipaludis]|uniref:N-acetyltransferase n=1 Tax=Shewanella salipaludis TaxID=2723052 RepID=A0A972G395_9GAMM|nr:GNAT family N-acetyltransferase [Shewanella salipaludis]NMH63630.1 N-acetyltransferase [Shewanella salipaludis]